MHNAEVCLPVSSRTLFRRKDCVKMNLMERECGDMDWTQLAQHTGHQIS